MIKDLSGQIFNRWTVIGPPSLGGKNGTTVFWICRCECGTVKPVASGHLKNGASASCGCLHKERAAEFATKHKSIKTREYSSWRAMKERCSNPNHIEWRNYGGRGIGVCQRWADRKSGFSNFINDMGKIPDNSYSIDRIDVNGDYSPENCKWSSRKEQANNRRNSVIVEYHGRSQTISQWSEETGIGYHELYNANKRGHGIAMKLTK